MSMPGSFRIVGREASVKPRGVEMKKSNVPVRGLVKTDGILGAMGSKINALGAFTRLTLKLISRSPVAGPRGSKPFWKPPGADVTWPDPITIDVGRKRAQWDGDRSVRRAEVEVGALRATGRKI